MPKPPKDIIHLTQGLADPAQIPSFQSSSIEEWAEQGRALGHAERVLGWAIGAWWQAGEPYGDRVPVVTASDWDGPSHSTCRNYATVSEKFDVSIRIDTLSFSHHRAVVSLPTKQATEILRWASREAKRSGEPPPIRMLVQKAKQIRRETRETEMAEATQQASAQLGRKLYSVIYADPPWRFEPRSRDSGMDRAADNHYATMTTQEICNIKVPAARDCVLFLWRTAPMARDAHAVMDAWGFDYRTEFIWYKPHAGTGYWNRNRHETLMVGVRGSPPAPAPGEQFESVIEAKLGRHSQKPAVFIEMIDEMYPHQRGLEMFSRNGYAGWDVHGNETGKSAHG